MPGAVGKSVETTAPRSRASASSAAKSGASRPAPRCSGRTATAAIPAVGTASPPNHDRKARTVATPASSCPTKAPQGHVPGTGHGSRRARGGAPKASVARASAASASSRVSGRISAKHGSSLPHGPVVHRAACSCTSYDVCTHEPGCAPVPAGPLVHRRRGLVRRPAFSCRSTTCARTARVCTGSGQGRSSVEGAGQVALQGGRHRRDDRGVVGRGERLEPQHVADHPEPDELAPDEGRAQLETGPGRPTPRPGAPGCG